MRINKKWWGKNQQRSVSDNASAIAFIAWRASQEALLALENAHFQTDTLKQRMDVIKEFLAFLTHIADRWCYGNIEEETRQEFIASMVKHNARTLQSSMEDIDGVKDYKEDYFNLINTRLADYSAMPFDEEDDDASFQMRAYLGSLVAEVMGEHDNKWIQDHIVALESKEVVENLKKGFDSLFKPAFNNPDA
ncbi:MAG: hypothetical protein QM504_16290 [Pseudomonadota bacterium]